MIRSKDELKNRPREIDLTGPDGNAFVLLGIARRWAKQLDLNPETVAAEMTDGDYENLIEVFESYFGDYVILYR